LIYQTLVVRVDIKDGGISLQCSMTVELSHIIVVNVCHVYTEELL